MTTVDEYTKKIEKSKIEFADYYKYCNQTKLDKLKERSRELHNFKFLCVNTSCFGGGVAETLATAIPFFNSLGINSSWKVLDGGKDFFKITKRMHDSLQGIANKFSDSELKLYEKLNKKFAETISRDYDMIEVNDFQLIPFAFYSSIKGNIFWRSHLDTSEPQSSLVKYYTNFLKYYNAHLFTHEKYIFTDKSIQCYQILPTIDPLRPKIVSTLRKKL